MIVGITGRIGAGKDTLAETLKLIDSEELGLPPHEIENPLQIKKMGEKIKQITAIILGIDRDLLEDREYKEKPLGEQWRIYTCDGHIRAHEIEAKQIADYIWSREGTNIPVKSSVLTPRKIMQLLGTEATKEIIHPHIWINSFYNGYSEDDNWLITDIRYPNEAESVRERNGVLIRIHRDNPDLPNSVANHPSETSLDMWTDWDYVVDNNGTYKQLYNKAKLIYKEVFSERRRKGQGNPV